MKAPIRAAALIFVLATSAQAGFDEGLAAYERGDYATALREWQPLAERGNRVAQYDLGVLHYNGQGVPQDNSEAVKWYRLAAGQGFTAAQYDLGFMHDKGRGVPQDNLQAVKWYRRAAGQGFANAQYNLGVMYGEGRGVLVDYVQAHMWFNLAAANSSGKNRDLSVKSRIIVARKMTAAQISEARELARWWRPRLEKPSAGE